MPSQPPQATRPSSTLLPAPRGRQARGTKVAAGVDTGRCSILSTSQSLAKVWGQVHRFPKPPAGALMALQLSIRVPWEAQGADLLGQDTPARAHIGCHGISTAVRGATPRLRGILSWARGSSAVMVPTRRAGKPSHFLNSKTVNTLRTGRLDFFPSRERTMLCSSS